MYQSLSFCNFAENSMTLTPDWSKPHQSGLSKWQRCENGKMQQSVNTQTHPLFTLEVIALPLPHTDKQIQKHNHTYNCQLLLRTWHKHKNRKKHILHLLSYCENYRGTYCSIIICCQNSGQQTKCKHCDYLTLTNTNALQVKVSIRAFFLAKKCSKVRSYFSVKKDIFVKIK